MKCGLNAGRTNDIIQATLHSRLMQVPIHGNSNSSVLVSDWGESKGVTVTVHVGRIAKYRCMKLRFCLMLTLVLSAF